MLHYALGEHSLCHLHESGDIGTADVVDVSVGLFAVFDTLLVYRFHDVVQALVDLVGAPVQSHDILRHLRPLVATPPALTALPGAKS